MAARIVVTPRSMSAEGGAPELAPLRERGYQLLFPAPGEMPSETQLKEALREAVGYIAGVEPISRELLETAGRLRAISRNGVGADNIDAAAADELGVAVLRAAGANAAGVAELTIGLMLALMRDIPHADAALKRGNWQRRKGRELAEMTLGLVGCGNIGRRVARVAAGFGTRVLAYDPYPDDDYALANGFEYVLFETVLAESDLISLHCPPPANGRPIVDDAALRRTKHGIYLINTARAELIDDIAVLAALESGEIAGAAVDTVESGTEAGMLAAHERVVATPHLGGYTKESAARAAGVAVENLLTFLEKPLISE